MEPRIRAWVLTSVLLPAAIGAAALLIMRTPALRPGGPTGTANDRLEAAIAAGDLSRAHAAIRDGANVSTRVRFAHGDLTGGRDYVGLPVVVAAARGDENVVRMLLAHGGGRGVDTALVGCVARALERSGVRQALEEWDPRYAQVSCPTLEANRPALLQLADLNVIGAYETRLLKPAP